MLLASLQSSICQKRIDVNKEDYGVDKYWAVLGKKLKRLLFLVRESVLLVLEKE